MTKKIEYVKSWVIKPSNEKYRPLIFDTYAAMVEYLFENERHVKNEDFTVSHGLIVKFGEFDE